MLGFIEGGRTAYRRSVNNFELSIRPSRAPLRCLDQENELLRITDPELH